MNQKELRFQTNVAFQRMDNHDEQLYEASTQPEQSDRHRKWYRKARSMRYNCTAALKYADQMHFADPDLKFNLWS